jgi:hypothetical protein
LKNDAIGRRANDNRPAFKEALASTNVSILEQKCRQLDPEWIELKPEETMGKCVRKICEAI